MHILEYKVNYKPEVAAGIELDANTAEDLAAHGHVVHLFIPQPSRGVAKEIAKKVPKKEVLKNGRLHIYRYGMYAEGKTFRQRLVRYCFCAIKQLWYGFKQKEIDLIFAGSTPPFQGVICSWIKRIKKVPFVFNCQDIFPDSLVAAGLTSKGSKLWNIGNRISDITYKAADKIIVISEGMRNTLVEKGVPTEKIDIVYNWVDESVIHPVKKEENRLKNELSIPDYGFTVVYAGNLGYAQGIDVILEAATLLQGENQIGFIFFGNGSMDEDVKNQICEKKLNNVCLYPLQAYERVSEVYSLGDACIVSCKPGTGTFAMPSKTWSIMGCGRPVLACFDKDTLLERIIEENDCGSFAEAGNAWQLADNILKMASNKEKTKTQGENARQYIEHYLSRKIGTDKICRLIDEVYENHRLNTK